jgi:hypothetical protein
MVWIGPGEMNGIEVSDAVELIYKGLLEARLRREKKEKEDREFQIRVAKIRRDGFPIVSGTKNYCGFKYETRYIPHDTPIPDGMEEIYRTLQNELRAEEIRNDNMAREEYEAAKAARVLKEQDEIRAFAATILDADDIDRFISGTLLDEEFATAVDQKLTDLLRTESFYGDIDLSQADKYPKWLDILLNGESPIKNCCLWPAVIDGDYFLAATVKANGYSHTVYMQ